MQVKHECTVLVLGEFLNFYWADLFKWNIKSFYQDKYVQYHSQTVAEMIASSFKTRSHDIVTLQCRGVFISLVNWYKTSRNYSEPSQTSKIELFAIK